MTYQRGTGSVELELSKVQSWVEQADPTLCDVTKRVDGLESSRDKMDGKLVIIVWLVGINVGLMTALILTLFAWGLNHITLKANFAADQTTSRNADLPSSYQPR